MKNKYVFVTVLLLVLLLTGAGLTQLYVKEETKQQDSELTVVTSFYPMYIAAMNVRISVSRRPAAFTITS
mgnify:CR=1 FL=1